MIIIMFVNPYSETKNKEWYKSNFHTHAGTGLGTCGRHEIDSVIAAYKEAGHQVLTISNHDIYSDVSHYQEKYDITLINGFEYSQGNHMLCINVEDVITSPHQVAIGECLEQGGFAILCHPNWQKKEYWSYQALDQLSGYIGIEIYNGVVFLLSGSGLATDTWDYLLSKGKLVWGFGNDDFHRMRDLDRAWNMICANSANKNDIIEATNKGNFYVSTGLLLNEFDFAEDTIHISVKMDAKGETYIKDYTYLFYGKGGNLLYKHYGESASYKVKEEDMYVRVHAISEHGAQLWTQPVYDDQLLVFSHS